jgi:hypothetical protein
MVFREKCGMNIPEGWKLVPLEPTPEMIEAGRDAEHRCGMLPRQAPVAYGYRAMVKAAPEFHPKGSQQGEKA